MDGRTLPELIPGDLFAVPPDNPFTHFFADLLTAKTFHWGLVVHPFLTEAGMDYEIMESIPSKGIGVGLLNEMYGAIPIRVYRVKATTRPEENLIERTADSYGRAIYGFTALPGIITWWIKFHFLRMLDAQPPAIDLSSVVCTAWVTQVWRDLGVDLVPKQDYPTPDMLETSEDLECIYSEF
jgi:hypothetical protein